jgi:hypothetical protein
MNKGPECLMFARTVDQIDVCARMFDVFLGADMFAVLLGGDMFDVLPFHF